MNTFSGFSLVYGRLSRTKNRFRWPNSFVVGRDSRFCLSHHPPSRGIATNNHSKNSDHVQTKWGLQPSGGNNCALIAFERNQSIVRTLSTVPGRDNEGDDIHRYRYRLYKYKICPFSNIAKVFLEYQMIPFELVEVNPLTKSELGFSEKYRKVPIVTILDSASTTPAAKATQQLNGTEEILPHDYQLSEIDTIGDSDEFSSSDSSIRWQDFAKTKLAPLLYPNMCRTLKDSFRAFDYVHLDENSFSTVQRYSIQYIGSVAMFFAASKIKEKYKIDDVQAALEETLTELESELSKEKSTVFRPVSSSDMPHLGDLSVFGVLKGLEGLPLWNEIFDDDNTQPNFPNIRQWYRNVEDAVATRKSKTPRYGFNN